MKNKITLSTILLLNAFNTFCGFEALIPYGIWALLSSSIVAIREYNIRKILKKNFSDSKRGSIQRASVKCFECDPELIQNPNKLMAKAAHILKKDFNQTLEYYPFISKTKNGFEISHNLYPSTEQCYITFYTDVHDNSIKISCKIYPLYARLVGREEDNIIKELFQKLEKEFKSSEIKDAK